MAVAVEMPKLGNTVEECLIARWVKQEGEAVSAGETVVEIETDKTSFEVAASVDGVVLATFFERGDLVPVFTPLFVIGKPGESVEALRPQSKGASSATAPDIHPANQPVVATDDFLPHSSAPMSPRARRFADEHDFHPAAVRGSGPGGRVLEADLRTLYLDAETPISSVREKIARRMRESLSNTAQYTLNSSAEASGLLRLRARIKASSAVPDININDLVTFCTVRALLEVPDLNVLFVDGKIHRSRGVHIGFACDTPRGLLVPVVRNAQALTVAALAARMKELSGQAVESKISADDVSGATFTISNLGGLGVESFTPLLNPPQVAILGVNTIQLKAVRRGDEVEFIDSIGLSLTLDHQIIDGAPGARFLKVVRDKIEKVEQICKIGLKL
ncbi:MAG: dihydrolipoamide acetyltransferase family protein [Terriglobales bacterium]